MRGARVGIRGCGAWAEFLPRAQQQLLKMRPAGVRSGLAAALVLLLLSAFAAAEQCNTPGEPSQLDLVAGQTCKGNIAEAAAEGATASCYT